MKKIKCIETKEIQWRNPGKELAMAAILLSRMKGELLHLRIFPLLSPQSNFIQSVLLSFSHGLKSRMHLDYCIVDKWQHQFAQIMSNNW